MYRIVITKEEDVVATEQVWQQIYEDGDTAESHGAASTHAYVDKKVEQVKETQLLDQRVEDLDIKAVIRAVNAMPEFIPKWRGKPITELSPQERAEMELNIITPGGLNGPANTNTEA